MSNELDLHKVRHEDVDILIENFVLLNIPPLTIAEISGDTFVDPSKLYFSNNDLQLKQKKSIKYPYIGKLG